MAQPSAPPVSQYIDIDRRRARGILGVGMRTLERLTASGRIDWVNRGKKTHKLLRYQSLVDFCDEVHQRHRIPDRRPRLGAGMRYRDEDLLPFPLADTICAKEACDLLDLRHPASIVRLVEEGKFEAYQLVPRGPWRISRSSLYAFMRDIQRPTPEHRLCYRVPATSTHF